MTKHLDKAAAADFSKTPKGFRVVTIGSGVPTLDKHRASPATLVQFKDKYFLVDIGPSSVARMMDIGIHPQNLTNLFITHEHQDHTGDFNAFLISGWGLPTGRRKLELVGPTVQKFYDNTIDLYELDLKGRCHLFTRNGIFDNVNISDLKEGTHVFEIDGVKITALPVSHIDFFPCYAYKFEADGESVVVTGDLIYTPEVMEFSRGCTILVVDGNQYSAFSQIPFLVRKAFMAKLDQIHISRKDMVRLAVETQAEHYVITHISGEMHDPEGTAKVFEKAGYNGNLYYAYDGMAVEPN